MSDRDSHKLRSERPEWRDTPSRPPRRQLPGVVALERVLLQSDAVAVALVRASVYRSGVELEILTVIHTREDELDPRLVRAQSPRPELGGPTLRIRYPNGLVLLSSENAPGTRKRDEPSLAFVAGRGARSAWRETLWWRPVPTKGPVSFECDWPSACVSGKQVNIAVEELVAAKLRAIDL